MAIAVAEGAGNVPDSTVRLRRIADFEEASKALSAQDKDKATGIFKSTGTIHGGQETTILTALVPLIYLGMVFVDRGCPTGTSLKSRDRRNSLEVAVLGTADGFRYRSIVAHRNAWKTITRST